MTLVEFNELGQNLHLNQQINGIFRDTPNTNGYKTLMFCDNDIIANFYCDFLYLQYFVRGKKITFEEAEYTIKNLCKFESAIEKYESRKCSL
jgi:hypothetical protein